MTCTDSAGYRGDVTWKQSIYADKAAAEYNTASHLAPDKGGRRFGGELDVVVQLVQSHVLGDVLGEGNTVGLGTSAGEGLVVREVRDLVLVVLVQEDRPRHLCVCRQYHKPERKVTKGGLIRLGESKSVKSSCRLARVGNQGALR